MFWSGKSNRSPIGIDVDSHLKAIQLEGWPGNPRVAAAAMLPRADASHIPAPAELDRLIQAMNRAGFTGRRVVLAAPGSKILGGILELPRAADIPIQQLARMELARTHRCAPDAMEVDCWALPPGTRPSKSAQVVAVAYRHDDANTLLDAFESAGLYVDALDARACALARAVAPLAHAQAGITAVLDMDWQSTLLILIHQNIVIYERKLADADLKRLQAGMCERLHLEAEVADYLIMEAGLEAPADDTAVSRQARALLSAHLEALASELSASFQFAAQQYADAHVEQLLVCGGGAAIPGGMARLAQILALPAHTLSPADLLACPRGQCDAGASPALVAALGLAMYDG